MSQRRPKLVKVVPECWRIVGDSVWTGRYTQAKEKSSDKFEQYFAAPPAMKLFQFWGERSFCKSELLWGELPVDWMIWSWASDKIVRSIQSHWSGNPGNSNGWPKSLWRKYKWKNVLETNQQNSHGVSKEEAKSQKTEDDGENPAFQNMLIENFSNYTKRRQFLTRRYHTKKVRTLNCFFQVWRSILISNMEREIYVLLFAYWNWFS